MQAIADLLTATFPELDGTAYVLDAPHILGTDLAGVTSPVLCFAFRDQLRERGLWRGPGFCCVVTSDTTIEDPLAVAVHELAHFLTLPPLSKNCEARFDAAPPPLQAFITHRLWDEREPQPEPPRVGAGGHDLRFIRAAAHAFHRIEPAAGRYISPRDVVHLPYYHLSSTFSYFAALRDECRERASEPIREILATPAPIEVLELWQSDIDRFHQDQEGKQ